MKRLFLIGAILVSCLFCINVGAEEIVNNPTTDVKEDITEVLESAAHTFYNWTYTGDGNWQFDEVDEISPEIVWNYMAYQMAYKFEDYAEYDMYTDPETGEEWPTSARFLVPADLFESVLKKSFNVTDNYIAEEIRYSNGINMGSTEGYIEQNGEYFYSYEVHYGWGSTGEYDTAFYGYNDLGNNKYEAYSYFLEFGQYDSETDEWTEYKPNSNEIYGKDYIVECYEYYDEEDKLNNECSAGKIIGYLKTVVEYDGEYIKYLAGIDIEKEKMPKVENVSLIESEEIKEKTDDVNINAPKGVFIEGTNITVEKQEKGNIFDVASKTLKEKFSSFVIYEINAKAGEYNVEPNGKVEISIKVPEGYKKPVIYYVSEDGKLEKLETKVEEGYAKAEVTHFSTYALVDEPTVVEKVVESVVENPETGIIGGTGILAVAGGCSAYFYNKTKKKNKFPQS